MNGSSVGPLRANHCFAEVKFRDDKNRESENVRDWGGIRLQTGGKSEEDEKKRERKKSVLYFCNACLLQDLFTNIVRRMKRPKAMFRNSKNSVGNASI